MRGLGGFLAEWGFLLLGVALVALWASPAIRERLARRREKAALSAANEPSRVQVLDEERRAARERQMAEYEAAAKAYREAHPENEKRKREERRKEAARAKILGPDGQPVKKPKRELHYFDMGFGTSPLAPGGGRPGFRPARFQPRRGG